MKANPKTVRCKHCGSKTGEFVCTDCARTFAFLSGISCVLIILFAIAVVLGFKLLAD